MWRDATAQFAGPAKATIPAGVADCRTTSGTQPQSGTNSQYRSTGTWRNSSCFAPRDNSHKPETGMPRMTNDDSALCFVNPKSGNGRTGNICKCPDCVLQRFG
jgi:hypothetical protein